MKKALLIASLLALIGTISCFPEPYIEVDSVRISSQGGYAVDRLRADMDGTLAGEHTLEIVWMWRSSSGSQTDVYVRQYLDLVPQNSLKNSWEGYSIIETSYGYVFTGYFWVEVYDEYGDFLKKSSEVYCYN